MNKEQSKNKFMPAHVHEKRETEKLASDFDELY